MTDIRMRGRCRAASLAAMALMLVACAGPQGGRGAATPSGDMAGAPTTAPSARRGAYYLDDGPGANPPVDLASIPDAVPQPEPLLPRATRPYSVFGRQYTPMTQVEPFRQRGIASWYGRRYHGQPTSSGERYDMYAMTAAHPTLPIPSYARVTNVANGRSVVVRVNDRGPFLQDRVIDLSYTAAAKLGYVEAGSAEVEVELVTQFDGAATKLAAAGADRAATAAGATSTPAPASTQTAAPSPSAAPPLALTLVPIPAANAASAVAGDATRLNVETVHSAPEASRPGAVQSPGRLARQSVVFGPGCSTTLPAAPGRFVSRGRASSMMVSLCRWFQNCGNPAQRRIPAMPASIPPQIRARRKLPVSGRKKDGNSVLTGKSAKTQLCGLEHALPGEAEEPGEPGPAGINRKAVLGAQGHNALLAQTPGHGLELLHVGAQGAHGCRAETQHLEVQLQAVGMLRQGCGGVDSPLVQKLKKTEPRPCGEGAKRRMCVFYRFYAHLCSAASCI